MLAETLRHRCLIPPGTLFDDTGRDPRHEQQVTFRVKGCFWGALGIQGLEIIQGKCRIYSSDDKSLHCS